MIRQQLMQLFGEAGQWASLVNASKLPVPHSSKLCNSTRTEYKFVSLLTAEMLLKDLAIRLGKYAGVTLTRAARIEEYTMHALAKQLTVALPNWGNAYMRRPGPRTVSSTEKDS